MSFRPKPPKSVKPLPRWSAWKEAEDQRVLLMRSLRKVRRLLLRGDIGPEDGDVEEALRTIDGALRAVDRRRA